MAHREDAGVSFLLSVWEVRGHLENIPELGPAGIRKIVLGGLVGGGTVRPKSLVSSHTPQLSIPPIHTKPKLMGNLVCQWPIHIVPPPNHPTQTDFIHICPVRCPERRHLSHPSCHAAVPKPWLRSPGVPVAAPQLGCLHGL